MSQQQLLKQELSVSQVLRIYGKQYTQITERYSDGHSGRCAIGVLMSYFGWNGRDDSRASKKTTECLHCINTCGSEQRFNHST
jgi:hypothetical protein